MSLKMGNIVCRRCSVRQITQLRICIFSKNINMFCHLSQVKQIVFHCIKNIDLYAVAEKGVSI